MSEKIYKPQIPDIMEAIFDCGYLLFDLIAGIFFCIFKRKSVIYTLWSSDTDTLRWRCFPSGSASNQNCTRKQ